MTAKRRWHSRWPGAGTMLALAAVAILTACPPTGRGTGTPTQYLGALDRPVERYRPTRTGRGRSGRS